MLHFEWEPRTAEMLRTLPDDFANMLSYVCKAHTDDALEWGLTQAKNLAPGDTIPSALGIFRKRGVRIGKYSGAYSGHIGFVNGNTLVEDIDVWTAPMPFNYGWIKHEGEQTPSAHPHKVFLYNVATGGSTKGRQKLVKYLKNKYGDPWTQLPDAPTKETWDNKPNGEYFPPPFVYVDPNDGATPYLSQLVTDKKEQFLDIISDGVLGDVCDYWTSWRP